MKKGERKMKNKNDEQIWKKQWADQTMIEVEKVQRSFEEYVKAHNMTQELPNLVEVWRDELAKWLNEKMYRMTLKVPSEYRPMEDCKAKTLRGAKRECYQRYRGDWLQGVMMIYQVSGDGMAFLVARRGVSEKRWTDLDV